MTARGTPTSWTTTARGTTARGTTARGLPISWNLVPT
jgi:hypothetical protein